MLVTYVIKGQVLSRAIHLAVHPASANDFGVKGRLIWFVITTCLLIVGWVLVNAVPFFGMFPPPASLFVSLRNAHLHVCFPTPHSLAAPRLDACT